MEPVRETVKVRMTDFQPFTKEETFGRNQNHNIQLLFRFSKGFSTFWIRKGMKIIIGNQGEKSHFSFFIPKLFL